MEKNVKKVEKQNTSKKEIENARNENEDFGDLVIDTKNGTIDSSSTIKSDKEYKVGDFVWAQMSTYPYWPAMITKSKDTNEHVKEIFKRTMVKYYHVHFFGDNGHWSWISSNSIMPFVDRNDLDRYKNNKNKKLGKDKVKFSVPTKSMKKWLAGLQELESLIDSNLQEKLSFFCKSPTSKPSKSTEKKEKIEPVKLKTKGLFSRIGLPSKKSAISPIKTIPKKRKRSLPFEETTSNYAVDNIIHKIDEKDKVSIEEQLLLFKKCNLFRGISKEKVCQVCEKFESVVKCKGPCFGNYHKDCALFKISDLEKKFQSDGTYKLQEEEKPEEIEEPEQDLNSVEISMEQCKKLDDKLKDVFDKLLQQGDYYGGSDDEEIGPVTKKLKKRDEQIHHVTADGVSYINTAKTAFLCVNCEDEVDQLCFVCHKMNFKGSNLRENCSLPFCGKYYHDECLKSWPQTQWNAKNKQTEQHNAFICPLHNCHTCVSDDPNILTSRVSADKLIKCLRCPATYHASTICIPAGSKIVTSSQMVCPRHTHEKQTKINTNWCYICGKNNKIIGCKTCPVSVHASCVELKLSDDGTFICEDCRLSRLPLYNEIVWTKRDDYGWWPAQIQFPSEIPLDIQEMPNKHGDFVVKFFQINDYAWSNRNNVFLYQEDDNILMQHEKGEHKQLYQDALKVAEAAYKNRKAFQSWKESDRRNIDV